MDILNDALFVLREWVRTYYLEALAIMAVAAGLAVFIVVDQLLRKFVIMSYSLRVRSFKKGRATVRRKFPKMPMLGGGTFSTQRIAMLSGFGLGVAAAVMAADPLLSITFLVCFPILGYALTLGMDSQAFINKRIQLLALLKIMIDDLEAFQSSQKACHNLYRHYTEIVPAGKRDSDFAIKLETLAEMTSSDQNLNDIVTDLFGSHQVYKPIADIVNFAADTGPASAVDYAKIVIKKGTMWKQMIVALNRQVTGIRFTALVLEALLVAGVFATFPTMLGADMSNMLHDYFFRDMASRLFLAGIVVAHTIVEYGFMDFLRVNTESI